MKQSSKNISSALFGLIAFIISMFFFGYYTLGDQEHYRLFYSEINNYSIADGFIAYRNYLGANEPVYFFIVYFLSHIFEKDVLFSIINGFFAFALAKVLLNLQIKPIILYSFLLNFYFLVLLFSAERLKVSLMFFLIAFLFKKPIYNVFFLFLSILSHLQALILVYVQKFSQLKKEFVKFLNSGNLFKILLAICIILGFISVIFVMRGYLQDKLLAYSEKGGISNVIKPIVFFFFTLYYSKAKWHDIFFMFLPLILASIVVGEERIVIFCYGIFMYYALQVKRGMNFGVFITNTYFIYKGIEFLLNIINNNNGFDGN